MKWQHLLAEPLPLPQGCFRQRLLLVEELGPWETRRSLCRDLPMPCGFCLVCLSWPKSGCVLNRSCAELVCCFGACPPPSVCPASSIRATHMLVAGQVDTSRWTINCGQIPRLWCRLACCCGHEVLIIRSSLIVFFFCAAGNVLRQDLLGKGVQVLNPIYLIVGVVSSFLSPML